MITETAMVQIERPERYAKQLASHMGHKVPSEPIENGWKLTFGIGEATLVPNQTQLVMTARAENLEDLKMIQGALDKHLLKFTTKLPPIEITWN